MSYLDWKVGDRVVCISSAESIAMGNSKVPNARYPTSNGVYTVRDIRDDNRESGSLALLLEEIDNSHLVGVRDGDGFGYKEPGFPINCFRKVQTRKTDISVFTAMLNKSKIDA